MASFYAELRVAGHVYPLSACTYGVFQATDERGRPVERVRHGRLDLTADVPHDTFLESWAAADYQPQDGQVVFFDTQSGPARETVSWQAGHCVDYHETFEAGNAEEGAYLCFVSNAAPKLVLSSGGPATAFVAPAARAHGVPSLPAISGLRQKLPVIPLADSIRPADWLGSKDLPSWTKEHKAARWAEYQRDKIALKVKPRTQIVWDKQYETNRNNNIFGLTREREYASAMGAESKVLKTKYTLRQIDMYKKDDAGEYCGQLKTGFVYLTKQAKIH